MTGELMTAKTIFRNEDGHLFRHLRYTATYDSENRVTSKEAFKWDSVKKPGCLISSWMLNTLTVKLS